MSEQIDYERIVELATVMKAELRTRVGSQFILEGLRSNPVARCRL
jgi:hypothetical protein